jgi:hypothetical protein
MLVRDGSRSRQTNMIDFGSNETQIVEVKYDLRDAAVKSYLPSTI